MRVHAGGFPSDQDYDDFESYINAVKQYRAQVEANIQGWLDSGIKEFSNQEGTRFGVVSPTFAAGDEGLGRITWYDKHSFSGHTVFTTEKHLYEELTTSLGYGIQPAEGSLDALSVTEDWARGMEHIQQVRDWNSKMRKKSFLTWMRNRVLP